MNGSIELSNCTWYQFASDREKKVEIKTSAEA